MTRADALRALLAKVEAGTATYADFHENCHSLKGYYGRAFEAYSDDENGLSGALALHEAVLSGWRLMQMMQTGDDWYVAVEMVMPPVETYTAGKSKIPARSWLIAIIKALIATEDN